MFNPADASNRIKEEFIDYISTSFSIADQEYDKLFKEKLNQHGSRITSLFNKLCRYIRAHSSSAQARLEPDFNVLQECYNEFKELDSIFKQ